MNNEAFVDHSHGRFVAALEHELERCRLFGREAAMVMVRDGGASPRPLRERARVLKRLIRPVDRLAFYSDWIVEVLLPESGWPQAEELARGWCAQQALGSDVVLAAGLAVYPDSGTSSHAILDRCREALRSVSPEQPVQAARSEAGRRAAPRTESAPFVFTGAMVTFPESGLSLRDQVRRYEAALIHAALRATGWRKSEAARLLQLPLRTLSRKVKDHAITRPRLAF